MERSGLLSPGIITHGRYGEETVYHRALLRGGNIKEQDRKKHTTAYIVTCISGKQKRRRDLNRREERTFTSAVLIPPA
jgi:hypothetical protein